MPRKHRPQSQPHDSLKCERIEQRANHWRSFGWAIYAGDRTAVVAPFSEACRDQFVADVNRELELGAIPNERVPALYALTELGLNESDRECGRQALEQCWPGGHARLSQAVDAPSYVEGGAGHAERERQTLEQLVHAIEGLGPGHAAYLHGKIGHEIRRLKEAEALDIMGTPLSRQIECVGIPLAASMVAEALSFERARAERAKVRTCPNVLAAPPPALVDAGTRSRER